MVPQILGALGGAYGAYAATPEGESPDIMNIVKAGVGGVANPVSGISSGVLAGVGELTNKNEESESATMNNSSVGNVPKSLTPSSPSFTGSGNGVNNSLNPAFGNPSINQKTQNVVSTAMSSDDQAKTMLNIA